MDRKKKFSLNLETFRDIVQIYPRVHGQDFDELPIDEVIVSFFKEFGHTRAQILYGMYYKKNVDYVKLLWENFTYQVDNRGHKKLKKMYYPRFTKVVIHYFLTKDKTVRKFKKLASPKLTTIPALPKELTKKSKRVKRPAKKFTNAPTTGVVIRDTLDVSISKKKAPAKCGSFDFNISLSLN
nr:hypothetical protein [Tanacetum cinerariifolium]